MKYRWLLPVLFMLVLSACSGFIAGKNSGSASTGGGPLENLALVSGGYLSTDDFNEISPFLYRDAASGGAWLFFSSDRHGGNYRIFYAKMDSDGRFEQPVEMSTDINYPGYDQTYPVVFPGYTTSYVSVNVFTNLYITFIRTSNSNSTLETLVLTNGFASVTDVQSITDYSNTVKGIGYVPIQYQGADLYVFTGSKSYSLLDFVNLQATYNNWVISSTTNTFTQNAASGNGFTFGDSEFMLLSTGSNINGEYFIYDNNNSVYGSSGTLQIGDYNPGNFIDRDPFIDYYSGGYQVYFASFRNGSNFDLYRYNNKTFDKYAELLPPVVNSSIFSTNIIDTNNITNNTSLILLNWAPALGAEGYHIYFTTNMIDFTLIFSIKDTNASLITNLNIFYQMGIYPDLEIKSFNGNEESTLSNIISLNIS